MEIRWDSDRTSSFDASERRHLDYAYALTSHSSQGQTSSRVLVHVETEGRIRAMVKLTEAALPVRLADLDADRYVVNVDNGTTHLPTGSVASREEGCRRVASFPFPDGHFPLVLPPMWR